MSLTFLVLTFISFLYNNICTYNTISTRTEIQKRDSEESLLTFVNLFSRTVLVNLIFNLIY